MLRIFLVFSIFAGLTCASYQITPEKQLEKNKATIAIIEDARNILKSTDKEELTKVDKSKIYAALGVSQSAISESQETIKECIEFKSKAIAMNTEFKARINKQSSLIFKLILIIIALSLWILGPFILRLIAKFTPAGQAIESVRSELQSLKDAVKK